MSIVATCSCGQSFAAKEHLAGKTVRCPTCGRPLTIPSAQAAVEASPAPTSYAANPLDLGASAPVSYPTRSKPAARPAWGRILGAAIGGFAAAFVVVLVVGLAWAAMSRPKPPEVNFGQHIESSFSPVAPSGQ